jgi:hypothetical protein
MPVNELAFTAMWSEANTDVVARQHHEAVIAARVALSGCWPFLAAAGSEEEFGHRLDLVLPDVVAKVAPDALDDVLARLREDYRTLSAERAAQAAVGRTAALRVTAARSPAGHEELPRSYVHVHAHGGGEDEYFQVDHVASPSWVKTLTRASAKDEAMDYARQFGLPAGLPIYLDGHHVEGALFPPVQAGQEFYDAESKRWIRVGLFTPDPSDAARYSHYPDPQPAPSTGGGVTQPGTNLGPDGFPVDLAEGEQRSQVGYQRQLTPGVWAVTPGTEWPQPPNAATGLPQGAPPPGGNAATGSRRSAAGGYLEGDDYGNATPGDLPSNHWHSHPAGADTWCDHCGGQIPKGSPAVSNESTWDIVHTPGEAKAYMDQHWHGGDVWHEMTHNSGDPPTNPNYQGPNPHAQRNNALRELATAKSIMEKADRTPRYCATCGINAFHHDTHPQAAGHPIGALKSEYDYAKAGLDQSVERAVKHASRHTGVEGAAPTPGPNPSYFAMGDQSATSGFPVDPAEGIEPKTDNRTDDFYGDVPPEQSSGSAMGQVDGQGYSRGATGMRHTAPGGGEHAPYRIKEEGGRFFVVNDKGEKKEEKGYATREQARRHQKALYVNVPGASESAEKESAWHRAALRRQAAFDSEIIHAGTGYDADNRYRLEHFHDEEGGHGVYIPHTYAGDKIGHHEYGRGGQQSAYRAAIRTIHGHADATDTHFGREDYPFTAARRDGLVYWAKEFTQEQRDKAAESGHALSDGSFPINSAEDVRNAKHDIGRTKHDRATVVKHINHWAEQYGEPKVGEEKEAALGPRPFARRAGYPLSGPPVPPGAGYRNEERQPPANEEDDCTCRYDSEGTCHVNPACREHGHFAREGVTRLSRQAAYEWGQHPATADVMGKGLYPYMNRYTTGPPDTVHEEDERDGYSDAMHHATRNFDWRGQQDFKDESEGYQRGYRLAHEHMANENNHNRQVIGPLFQSIREQSSPEQMQFLRSNPTGPSRYSKRAATDGLIVGHCDHCRMPVRWHTAAGGEEEEHLEHLHNGSHKCGDGAWSAKVSKLAAVPHPKTTIWHPEHPGENYRVTCEACGPVVSHPAEGIARAMASDHQDQHWIHAHDDLYGQGSHEREFPWLYEGKQAPQFFSRSLLASLPPAVPPANDTGAGAPPGATPGGDAAPGTGGPSAAPAPAAPNAAPPNMAPQRVGGRTLSQPTPENPSGLSEDEYRANTWEGLVKQRPMQPAEQRGINTPTQPGERLQTRQINTPTPGLGDQGSRGETDMDEDDTEEDEG